MIFIDINKFKIINDVYGHSTGDAYLKFIAEHLGKTVRATDMVGRWGGDEFLVFMPEISRVSAQKIATKLINGLCSSKINIHGHAFTPSASFGLASIEAHIQRVDALIHIADAAMYSAKKLTQL